jgi:Zn-dependent alcohol dehydrogenase
MQRAAYTRGDKNTRAQRAKCVNRENLIGGSASKLFACSKPSTAMLVDVPKPKVGSGQVVIKVGGDGLCHTDVALMRRRKVQWDETPPPMLGHEIAQ